MSGAPRYGGTNAQWPFAQCASTVAVRRRLLDNFGRRRRPSHLNTRRRVRVLSSTRRLRRPRRYRRRRRRPTRSGTPPPSRGRPEHYLVVSVTRDSPDARSVRQTPSPGSPTERAVTRRLPARPPSDDRTSINALAIVTTTSGWSRALVDCDVPSPLFPSPQFSVSSLPALLSRRSVGRQNEQIPDRSFNGYLVGRRHWRHTCSRPTIFLFSICSSVDRLICLVFIYPLQRHGPRLCLLPSVKRLLDLLSLRHRHSALRHSVLFSVTVSHTLLLLTALFGHISSIHLLGVSFQ